MYFHLKKNKNDIETIRWNKLKITEPKNTLFKNLYFDPGNKRKGNIFIFSM